MDEGGFILDYWAPPGGALAETNRQVTVLEEILRRDPDVEAFTRRTGLELGFAATLPNSGDFTVRLKARGNRNSSVYEVMDRVRVAAEAEAPAVRVEFVQLLQDVIGDLAGAPAPVEIKLFGTNRAAAERAAATIAQVIEPTPGLVDLFNGVRVRIPSSGSISIRYGLPGSASRPTPYKVRRGPPSSGKSPALRARPIG